MRPIFADFNNFDENGCLMLNGDGTVADLNARGIALVAGLELTFSDGDLVAQGVVVAPVGDGVWSARIIGEIRDCS